VSESRCEPDYGPGRLFIFLLRRGRTSLTGEESTMPLTEWDKSYELGMPELDEHHRKLVELLNKTYDLILYSTNKDEIQAILAELIKYTEYHFEAEERMMKEAGFPGLKTQVTDHDTFKKQLAGLRRDYLSGAPKVNTDIVLFLWDWLKNHIIKGDKAFEAFLSQH
jgi:hemerythrin